VEPVGVFVNEDVDFIRETCGFCGIRIVQLHGDEPPSIVGKLRAYKVIKAFRVRSERDLTQLRRYDVDAYLLDAYVPGKRGGTGATVNWELAKLAAELVPVLLAGGLTPENVAQAIHIVRPYAVDVCSGVESEPGKKDRLLLRKFIYESQRAFLEASSKIG
jgi:phosphoribosylanthranilate isomerase